MSQGNATPPSPREPRPVRWLLSAILGVILLVLLVVGYLLVSSLLAVRRPIVSVGGTVATQVQEVLNPTPTILASPATIVLEVRTLSRLETASYSIEKVITAESGEGPLGFLFQDRLLLVARGQVIAGVDLARLQEQDVQVVGSTVYVTLPAAEIFVATLNNDETFVYDRQTGVFGQQIDLETLARQEAEQEILSAALEDGILDMADQNAQLYVEGLIRALGFDDVVFVRATPAPDQDMGDR